MARKNNHPAIQYAEDVRAGRIVACKWVKLAVTRYFHDVKTAKKRALVFNEDKAQHAINFFQFLKHSKGEWAGQFFNLSPWQEFILWNLFGWYKMDGLRRFRIAYQELARKNGKSTFLAGIGLYLFFADGEAGAEVYSAATKKEQARITHSEAERMVKSSPALKSRINVFRFNLHIADTASKFEPLSSDSNSMDGLNIHGAIIDELHAHKSREIWDVIETATGSRRQPMILAITTAGHGKHNVCLEQREYGQKILEGIIDDDSYFVFIATIDEGDDWRDEAVWIKANPNLGVSVKLEDLRRKARKAENIPAAQNAFRNKHLSEWTEQEVRWIDIQVWDNCKVETADYNLPRVCFGGLDLGSNKDLSALTLLFPNDNGFDVKPFFWMPEDNIYDRIKESRVPYDRWIEQGYIHTTPGNTTDYNHIYQHIIDLAGEYEIQEIAFDRMFAGQLSVDLADEGLTMVPFGQGFYSMAAPTKELEKLILAKEIHHNGNPVLRWMMSNISVKLDPAGNMKPDKPSSAEKIDGVVAMIMALGRAMVQPKEEQDAYAERGILTV